MPREMLGDSRYQSVNEFWQAALDRLRIYVEEGQDSERLVHDLPNCKVPDAQNAGPAARNEGAAKINR